METTTFGKTGLKVSRLGFGGAPIGYLKTDHDRVTDILKLLLDSGVNFIDTAASYPGSEEAIGKTLGSRRDQCGIVSKCGSKLPDISSPSWSKEMITATVDRSLRNLGTDHLDVMLLHSCDLAVLQKGEAMEALVRAREAGKIKFAGYSGDNEAAAYAATLPDIAVIETSVNIADQANLHSVLPATREHNVGVIAKRPIANAAWKRPDDQPGLYKGYAQTYHDRLRAMNIDPRTLGMDGIDAWPEMALRFTLGQPGVHVAIIGTTSPQNARANMNFAAKGPLPADVVRKIERAFADADTESSWTGQT